MDPTSGESSLEMLSPFELKDRLLDLADESTRTRAAVMFNAGRGNPNWIATVPREAFFLLGTFALQESRRSWDEPGVGLGGMPHSVGIGHRFRQFLASCPRGAARGLLHGTLELGLSELGFEEDAFVWEMVDALVGDNYPVPDRMLVHAERVVEAFLAKEMCAGAPPPGRMKLFAVEGGTAAMTYVFHSLVTNRLLEKGDTIALGTPVFTPYLEIPHLEEYRFEVVPIEQSEVEESGRHTWQYPDKEIDKLEDPRIKAFFVVNPGNPGAVAIRPQTLDRVVSLVKSKRPDLLILTDDVYGTFVEGFRSFAAVLPHNTILVYSYSKHFGCTGWRLGVIGMHEEHVADRLISKLPPRIRGKVNRRYHSLTPHPENLRFIDRLVADSRSVALNHTAGLSLPQQLMMMLFSSFALLDKEDAYKRRCRQICHDRLKALFDGLGVELRPDELATAYYQTLDLEAYCQKFIGQDFMDYVKAHRDPLDIVFTLARRYGTVLLNGSGFHGPPWSARVSLANLEDEAYSKIGRHLMDLVNTAVERWKQEERRVH
jgi:aspartate 4-decarboxylase